MHLRDYGFDVLFRRPRARSAYQYSVYHGGSVPGRLHRKRRNWHGYETVLLEEGWHSVLDSEEKCNYQLWFEKTAPGKDMNATGLHYTDHTGGRAFMHADSLHPTYWTAQRAVEFLESYKEDRPW
jgi:hypothetical protein